MRVLRRMLASLALLVFPLGAVIMAAPVGEGLSWRDALSLAADDPVPIDWRTLAALDLETGRAPASLAALDGKRVVIAAFIVPLEDDMQQADEFLLVPYFGACVHTPPPPPNQMRGRKTIKIGWWDPVQFEGILHLKQVESPYGASYFEMEGLESKAYTPPTK